MIYTVLKKHKNIVRKTFSVALRGQVLAMEPKTRESVMGSFFLETPEDVQQGPA